MIFQQQDPDLVGVPAVTADGEQVGTIAHVYADEHGEEPSWVTIRTGLFGGRESFVPTSQARREGDAYVLAHDKDQVTGAPQLPVDGHLSDDDVELLYRYYSLVDPTLAQVGTKGAGNVSGGYYGHPSANPGIADAGEVKARTGAGSDSAEGVDRTAERAQMRRFAADEDQVVGDEPTAP